MNKLYFSLSSNLGKSAVLAAGLMLLSGGMVAGAQCLKPVGSAAYASERVDQQERVIIDEDFSRFAAGSNDAPDATNIANRLTGEIASGWTKKPGWTGAAIYQAGGACAILTGKYQGDNGPYEDTGFLRTPIGDYAGDLTLTFRARLVDAQADDDLMAVILNSVNGRLEVATKSIGKDWADFTVNFSKGLFSGCLIEFTMQKKEVLIDDIRVTSRATSLPAPVITGADKFTADGFTANWLPVASAEKYVVNIYERDVEGAVSYVDFEEINTLDGKHIDPANSGLPEDWTFAYGNSRGKDISDKGYGGSQGIVFDATDDGFITPLYDGAIRDFSFYACHPSGVECLSNVRFSALVGGEWVAFGNIDVETMAKEGDIIDISSKIPAGARQIQMMFNKNVANDTGKDVSIVIDHIRIMTEPAATPVQTGLETQGASLKITGLDAAKDYSYTVKAFGSGLESAVSENVMARGLIAPELHKATAVTADSYCASWGTTPKADGYLVSNYKVYRVPEYEEVTILYENFDKVKKGTLEKPVGLYNVANPKALDDYTANPDWYGVGNYLVEGMMGARSYMVVSGCIQTPALDLSGDEGRFSVYLTVYGDTDAVGDSLVVQAGAKVFSRQLIDVGHEAIDMVFEFECGEASMPLLIYSYNGMPFYIDEITVSQMLNEGDLVYHKTENRYLAGNDTQSTVFSGLGTGEHESLAYRVFAYRNFYGGRVYSVSDAAMHVEASAGVEEISVGERLKVSADGLTLAIDAVAATSVKVFGADGRVVADIVVPEGRTALGLPSVGLYFVAAGDGSVTKISVR